MDPANANNLPEATRDDIEREFINAIDEFAETTTLDVKNVLRSKGFWVNQADVSSAIADIARDPKYAFRFDSGHRVYSLAFLPGIPAGRLISMHGSAASTPAPIKAPTLTSAIGSWEVFGHGGPLGLMPTEQYDNCTRNKARYTYSKQYAIPYVKTVAKKI